MRWMVLLLALAAALAHGHHAVACAPAPPDGVMVDIVGEDALIVWDEARHRQHFIRRADFRSGSARGGAAEQKNGFGFLVPTPSVPELGEVNDDVFERLEDEVRPPVRHERSYDYVFFLCDAFLRGGAKGEAVASAMDDGVRVLHTQRVAGYDAAVLEADDAGALQRWLGDHGYAFRPELREWLGSYIAAKWKITAFKIASEGESNVIGSSAVRMSFDTERPFFPYREPTDQAREAFPRSLRVFFVSSWRADGALEQGTWPGKLLHADRIADPAALLAGALPAGAAPGGAWLSYFVDASSPRPAKSDLFFSRSPVDTVQRLPPVIVYDHVTIPILVDVLAFAAFMVAGVVTLVRRRRRRA